MSRQFLSFLLVGGVAAAANWGSNLALSQFMPLEVSIVFAFVIGLTTAYALNRLFVFAASGRSVLDEFGRFALVNLIALAQVWLITIALVRFLLPALGWDWYPEAIAHAVGVGSPIVTSYFAHRYFTFSRQNAA